MTEKPSCYVCGCTDKIRMDSDGMGHFDPTYVCEEHFVYMEGPEGSAGPNWDDLGELIRD